MVDIHSASFAVIFLPGTLCNAEVFAPQVKMLTVNDINSLVIDFGDADCLPSMREKTAQQVKKGGFTDVVIVGFSMGGMLVFELLRELESLDFTVQQIMLVASNAHADSTLNANNRQQHLTLAKRTSLRELLTHTYLPNYLYNQDDAIEKIIIDMAEALGIAVFASQLKVLAQRPDSSKVLENLQIPCCIVAGKYDRLCPPSEQSRMATAAQISQQAVKLVMLDDCGHFATLEQAEKINQLLLTLISTQPVSKT